MYSYEWDMETGGILLNSSPLIFSKEPRPVYYKELNILGFDKYWNYKNDDTYPIMWAEANTYWYKGRLVAKLKGGSLYTAPEINIIEEPEKNDNPLSFVDIAAMVEKNRDILEKLSQETIKKIYNSYIEFKKKIDVFYVAFSGGKDSVVVLDLVQKALPHNEFKVVFGDTGMEFPDTYDVITSTQQECHDLGIDFLHAKSHYSPKETWNLFGPPAQKMRWCCGVHKTAPQVLLLRQLTQKNNFTGMAFVGIRADESVTRRKYEELNLGKKHKGQFDFYPILTWNSAEIYLYMYCYNLLMNITYKSGNSRAGCLVCPMEAKKNSWFKAQSYREHLDENKTTTLYENIILETTIAKQLPQKNKIEFMEIGVWKSRHNGGKLNSVEEQYFEEYINDKLIITINYNQNWTQWIKTLGKIISISSDEITIEFEKIIYHVTICKDQNLLKFIIANDNNTKNAIKFKSAFKNILKKTAYCVLCKVCEANCVFGYIKMENECLTIDDSCTKCKICHQLDSACLRAASLMLPKKGSNMSKSIDRYKNMGVKYSWIEGYFKEPNEFWENNTLGSMMITALRTFLLDSEVCVKNQFTDFGKKILQLGIDTQISWGLIVCNLTYSPQFYWWIKNIEFDKIYTKDDLNGMLSPLLSDNSRKNAVSGYKNIFSSNSILAKQIGMGECNCEKKGTNTLLIDIKRTPWQNPDPVIILYSLYKFAEKCGDYYQFTLSRLLNHSIESDGVSPTEIFGIDREQMEKILNGLSINYPEFINASFTLDLDNITLRSDKTSSEVLELL